MKKQILSLIFAGIFSATLLAGCGGAAASSSVKSNAASGTDSQSSSTPAGTGEEVVLVVGASPAPHAEILEQVVPVLAKQGIKLEIKEFTDYVLPNTAVEDGSIDANYFQHQPYLDDFNAKNGTSLVTAGAIHIEPLGIYPGRVKTLEELPEGALIGIPNDTTNESRALYLLADQGLIELDSSVGFEAVPTDITSNPHNLKFKELEAAQLPGALPDLDFAVINGNYAVGAGIGDTALATENADSPYVNVVAVREGDENRPEIKALITALQSDEIRTFINEKYDGIVVPVF